MLICLHLSIILFTIIINDKGLTVFHCFITFLISKSSENYPYSLTLALKNTRLEELSEVNQRGI